MSLYIPNIINDLKPISKEKEVSISTMINTKIEIKVSLLQREKDGTSIVKFDKDFI
ncbi:MAG: hypothetical protein ABJB76_13035 [Candidatus Nitrosocosmicus sp.]